jgi:hypothetical protein
VDLTGLSRAQWAMVAGVLAVMLGIFVLPWRSVDLGPFALTASAWDSGSWGRLAVVATLGLVVGIGVMTTHSETALPFPLPTAMLAGGAVILLTAALEYADSASPALGYWVTIAGAILVCAGGAAELRAPRSPW